MPPVGTPLPHLQEAGCIYLDYNATTPIFPEVSLGQLLLEALSSGVGQLRCCVHVAFARCITEVQLLLRLAV